MIIRPFQRKRWKLLLVNSVDSGDLMRTGRESSAKCNEWRIPTLCPESVGAKHLSNLKLNGNLAVMLMDFEISEMWKYADSEYTPRSPPPTNGCSPVSYFRKRDIRTSSHRLLGPNKHWEMTFSAFLRMMMVSSSTESKAPFCFHK